jgi:hypothetical protein
VVRIDDSRRVLFPLQGSGLEERLLVGHFGNLITGSYSSVEEQILGCQKSMYVEYMSAVF